MTNITSSLLLLFVIISLHWGCKTPQPTTIVGNGTATVATDDGIIKFTFLQINDVYEISPKEGGKVGGMARVASLYQQLKRENPNTLFVLAGDFLNPSLYGTIKGDNGKPVAGRQMIEVMNTAGVDVVAFGNHEFDLSEAQLQERINLSEFAWIGTNVLQKQMDTQYPFRPQSPADNLHPFYKQRNGNKEYIPETYSWQIKDADGTALTIGLFSATINSNPKDYVVYEDFKEEAVKTYLELHCSTDFVLGLTHLGIREDMQLASMLPNVPLFMGGHEHDNMKVQVGAVTIAKADADAKTAWVHHFTFNKKDNSHQFTSELVAMDEQITEDPLTKQVVAKWENILNDKIQEVYPQPQKIIYQAAVPLDASLIRYEQTNLGAMLCNGILAYSPVKAIAAMMNSGSVRIEDHLENDIQAIDIFKALPFPGYVAAAEVRGDTLLSILQQGLVKDYGSGEYLQIQGLTYDADQHIGTIAGQPIQINQSYSIGLNDYLLSFLVKKGTLPKQKFPKGKDVRVAIIEYMDSLPKRK